MIPLTKVRAILVYLANNTEKLGKVKLMKLIYFLDFIHVKKYGRPITFDQYIHIAHGPVPSRIKDLIDDLEDSSSQLSDSIAIKIVKTQRKPMRKIVAKRDFSEKDRKLFSETELEVLKEVVGKFKYSTSDEIEKASHDEAPWKETNYLDKIPYSLAAKDKGSKLKEEEIELLLKTT